MTNLPFLKPHGWPQKAKISGESKYGFDEDDELIESALDELIEAIHSKEHKRAVTAIRALMDLISSDGEQDVTDT